jgi:RNA polymerase sigma-70 factor (ECF subfamily)
MQEAAIIAGCVRQDRRAQRALYDRFAPLLFAVVRRYVSSYEDAEDVLAEVFYKIFTHIDGYRAQGSLEGWLRRIAVNESLMFLRKQHALRHAAELDAQVDLADEYTAVEWLAEAEILQLLDQLPQGYRTVFNLYVIEGYKHREIAELLGISINTSKSQLILAKKRLRELLIRAGYEGIAIVEEP